MRLLILGAVLFLSACYTAPVKQQFPPVAPELLKKCEDLKKIEGDAVTITEMLKTIVHNYTLYHECSTKVEGWQDWYNSQKKIYEKIK